MTPEEHADHICRWTNASLRDLVVHEIGAAILEEREACIKIAEETARVCDGSRLDNDKTRWAEHGSHSDAHDYCHEALRIAAAIRAR